MAWLRDPDRPVLLSVVFWLVLAATVAANLWMDSPALPRVLFYADVALLCALWPMLPWRPGRGRRLVAPVFLAGTLVLGLTGASGLHLPLLLIGVVNLAFVYGVRVASAILAGFALVLLGGDLFVYRNPIERTLAELAMLGVLATFSMGLASAVLRARALAERVRELTVAEERARMAAEMHDSVGHHLTVIKVGLENAERFRDRRPEAAWEEVAQAKELTTAALADARRWVRALRPLPLHGRLGSDALRQLADTFAATGVTVTFEVAGAERALEPDAELVLYRVLQEGLTNALRHAEADSVRGVLTYEKRKVVLVVADDGRGHDEGHGFGLSSLAERVRALGGTLTGGNGVKGFELRVELPA